MSYFVEILEWFSKHSKRKLSLFEEADPVASGQQDANLTAEYNQALAWAATVKGKHDAPNKPFLAKNGNKILIYTTAKGLIGLDHGNQTTNSARPNFSEILKSLLKSKESNDQEIKTEEPNQQQTQPEQPQPELPKKDLVTVTSESLIGRLWTYVLGENFEKRIEKLRADIIKKYTTKTWGLKKDVPRPWKRNDRNKPHMSFWQGTVQDIERAIKIDLVEKIKKAEVITEDGSMVTPEQHAEMIERTIGHVIKITEGSNLTSDDAYFYKENVKLMRVGGTDRVIIYSEPDENGKRVSISLPHTREVRAVFSDLLVDKINDSLPEEQQIEELRSVTSSEAYSSVFGTLMEKIHVTFINLDNARKQVEQCQDEETKKRLQKYCDHFESKLKELNEDLRKTALRLLERASKITSLISEDSTLIGDSELIEALSQAMGEVSELFEKNYISEIEKINREYADNPEEAKKQKQILIRELSKRIVTETSRYQRELNSIDDNNVLEGVALSVMAGDKYKFGARRQDVHYFSVNKESADALSSYHKTKSEVISVDDVDRLKELIPDDNDREYLIERAKNEGSNEIYLNRKSLKNSMSERFEVKLATDSADHSVRRNELIISLLDETDDAGKTIISPKSKAARDKYNEYLISKNARPLTEKEFAEMIDTFKSRVGKHIKSKSEMKTALDESKKRTRIILDISSRALDAITKTKGGKEVTTSDLKNVADMVKKELGIDLSNEKLSELQRSVDGILKKKPPDTKKLRILLQRSISSLLNESTVEKIKSGDKREANVLVADLYSRGMSAENTGVISYQNFETQEAGLVTHNDLLDDPCEVITDLASGGNKNRGDLRATDTGITFDVYPTSQGGEKGSVTMRTDFNSGNGGSTVIHADHGHIRNKSHTKKKFAKESRPTIKGKEN